MEFWKTDVPPTTTSPERIKSRRQCVLGTRSRTGVTYGDIKAIQHVQNEGLAYVAEYKRDFFFLVYGIEFDDAAAKLPSFPWGVIRAFDVLASVRELHAWERHAARQTVESLAKEITEAALDADADQLATRFQGDGDLAEKVRELDRLFMTAA